MNHGSAIPDTYGKRDEIQLSELGAQGEDVVSLRYVAEIIQARMEEIFGKVEAELRAVDRSGLLPAGAILTGGGAKLNGAVECAKAALRLPASIASASHMNTTMPEYVQDPAFSTAIGLVQWGFDEMKKELDRPSSRRARAGKAVFGKIGSSVSRIFKSFIP